MKIIWFVKVISRTRYSKKYLNKIGVNGKRVALITWPMTYLFGRSHMRVSGRKMKKKRCVWKWCIISWQMEIYRDGGIFYKISMKNVTIKPRTNKIKTKFKKFLFLIYNIMKKALYSANAEYLILPKRLWKLVEIYWKPVKTMLEYDPSKVDDKRGNVGHLYYVSWRVSEKNFTWTIYWDYETAEEIRSEKTKTAIWRVMQEKWYKIMDFAKKDARIKELEEENEELKSLPPVEIEQIGKKIDIVSDENLTKTQKRGRSNWEK